MLKKILTEKRALAAIVVFGALFLIVPNIIRLEYFDNYMLGQIPYYHAKIARDIMQGTLYPRNHYPFDPYDYLLAFAGKHLGILTATNLIPFAAGVLSTILFFILLRRFGFTLNQTSLIVLFWVISPLYIYSFTVSNPFAIIILLNLAGFSLLLSRRLTWLSIPVFAIIPFFGIQHAVLTILLIFFYSIKDRERLRQCTAAVLLLFAISACLVYFGIYGLQNHASFGETNLLQDNIVGLGAVLGFSLITVILAMIGLLKSWNKRNIFASIYIMLILLFTASYFLNIQFKFILNIGISLYAALGLIAIIRMKWEQKLIRNLTLMILILGISFSSMFYVYRLSFMGPSIATINNLEWLGNNSVHGDVVLSDYRNGYWIEYFSGREAGVSPDSTRETYNETLQLLRTRNEEKALVLLEKYHIRYVFIDSKTLEDMKDGNNRIGLLFLMQNSADFEMVRKNQGFEIWKFTGS